MTNVLAVTSSTAAVGVAAAHDGVVVAAEQVTTDRRHAEELTPMVASVLAAAGWVVTDVDIFAVDVGPGRFTGLRVGLATVRALALAVEAPVVGITSLELLAADHDGPVSAVIDARRNEVFHQRFVDGIAVGDAVVGPAIAMAELVEAGDAVIGDGGDRYAEIYAAHSRRPGHEPMATTLARLAFDRPAVPGPEVVPLYLRDADVQINIKTRHNT
jgi:tRNA threonylcarbamoyladenosine biosynthesis protein TsaB